MFDSLVRFSKNNAITLSVTTLSVALYILYKKDYLHWAVPNSKNNNNNNDKNE